MKSIAILAAFLKLAVLLWSTTTASANDEAKLWSALRDGKAFAIMRHALAPGTGDPDNFKINDCTTQRNLSDVGRKQAVKIGNRFRRNGIKEAHVFTSQWCRCRETAKLLTLGPATELPPLNSFFQNFEQREPQTQQLLHWLKNDRPRGVVILSTHQVNIYALTNRFTNSGEIIVSQLTDGKAIKVLGSLRN
ncbi:MAG: histidine phosphatase family protein [Pseudomonadota bacterium]